MVGVRHVDDVLAMEGVNRFSEGCAGLLCAEVVLVVLVSLWWFLYGWHRAALETHESLAADGGAVFMNTVIHSLTQNLA